MNNKGFTLIELLIAIALLSSIMFVIIIPVRMLQDYNEYIKLTDGVSDGIKVRIALQDSLKSSKFEVISANKIRIDNAIYIFESDGLYIEHSGESVKLSEKEVFYELIEENNKKTLKLYNQDFEFEYVIENSSFELDKERGNAI